jgi:F0F1-type ATP synthase membrane subunit c/vacuolar-type H+-ATPase subunit K
MTTRAGVATIAPLVGVAVALLFALHDRFDLVENRLIILVGLAVAAVGIALRARDARSGDAASPDARAMRRRTLLAVAVFGAASVVLAVARAIATPSLGLRDDLSRRARRAAAWLECVPAAADRALPERIDGADRA